MNITSRCILLLLVTVNLVLVVKAVRIPQQSISFNDDFDAGTIKTIGNAHIVSGSLLLTNATTGQASSIIYNASRFSIVSGFYSAINISVDSCSSGSGSDGFTLFLTPDAPTTQQMSLSSGGGLGISGVPNVYMAGYSSTTNYFHTCSWVIQSGQYGDVCPTVSNTGQQFGCGPRNNSLFEFYYSTSDSTMLIYYDGQLRLNKTLVIPQASYWVGISGSTGLSYYRQIVHSWNFTSYEFDVPSNLNYERNFTSGNITLYGISTIVNGSLILTPASTSTAGAIVYDSKVGIWGDFYSSLVIAWQNCSQSYGGGDGFLFFLTPDLLDNQNVSLANGNKLGLLYSTNIYTAGYSSSYDYIFTCQWAVFPDNKLLTDICPFVSNSDPSYLCNGEPYLFEFYFDSTQRIMTVSVNGSVKSSMALDVPYGNNYYVGISGATGGAWFKQTISSWTFTNDPLTVFVPVQLQEPITAVPETPSNNNDVPLSTNPVAPSIPQSTPVRKTSLATSRSAAIFNLFLFAIFCAAF